MVGVSVRALVGGGMVGGVMRLGVRSAWRRWFVVAQAHIRGAQSDLGVAIPVQSGACTCEWQIYLQSARLGFEPCAAYVLHQALVEAGLMLRQYLILLDFGFVCDGLEDCFTCAAVVGA